MTIIEESEWVFLDTLGSLDSVYVESVNRELGEGERKSKHAKTDRRSCKWQPFIHKWFLGSDCTNHTEGHEACPS